MNIDICPICGYEYCSVYGCECDEEDYTCTNKEEVKMLINNLEEIQTTMQEKALKKNPSIIMNALELGEAINELKTAIFKETS